MLDAGSLRITGCLFSEIEKKNTLLKTTLPACSSRCFSRDSTQPEKKDCTFSHLKISHQSFEDFQNCLFISISNESRPRQKKNTSDVGSVYIWVFPKIGGKPPKWMVYNGKPYQNGWFGGTPIFGNTRMLFGDLDKKATKIHLSKSFGRNSHDSNCQKSETQLRQACYC